MFCDSEAVACQVFFLRVRLFQGSNLRNLQFLIVVAVVHVVGVLLHLILSISRDLSVLVSSCFTLVCY